MFIIQPTAKFGDRLGEELAAQTAGQRAWHTFEFAVAWVNRSGAESITDRAREFLAAEGCIRATVGLDFGSTSYEGLGQLLDLEGDGADITTHVFRDENPASTFHPKVFLFSNMERARLFVGSNNMTGAGLETNVEAALEFEDDLTHETIRTARDTLSAWRDEGDLYRRIRRLTRELLEQLRDLGYVLTEEELRRRRNFEIRSRPSRRAPLFGRTSAGVAVRVIGTSSRRSARGRTDPDRAEMLLMRVRKRRNGNQIQFSMRVLKSSFMNGATEVVLTDGSRRSIAPNAARGGRNTERFEAPGLKNMTNPVARLRWIDVGDAGREADIALQFELFDADSGGEGAVILRKLEQGISTPPVTNLKRLSREQTVLSKRDRESAQWYRLVSV